MRQGVILGAILGFAGLCALASQSSRAEEAPKRKPGLWEITTVAPVSGMTKSMVCVTEDDDIVTPSSGACTKPKLRLVGGEIFVDVVCTNGGGKQTISTALTGDFETRYRAVVKSTFDPPVGTLHNMGVIIEGKFIGTDCEKAARAK